jgi:molybdenum ABC transporter molybdate-binding protein
MSNTPEGGAPEHHAQGDGWGVGLRVWVERAGRQVLGPEELAVLEAIDRRRSISAAARETRISYRRAWELVQGMNETAGEPLVTTATGGVQGGGAWLTPLGRWAMAALGQSQEHLRQTAAGLVPRLAEGAGPAALHVAAAVSLEEVLGQVLTDYAAAEPAVRVRTVFGASDELADYLLAGSPGHLFLTADPLPLGRLEAAGLLLPGPAVALAENGLAAVATAGRGLSVRKAADLAGDDAVRVALAGPDCPLGRYTRAYLEGLGLYERVLTRALRAENSRGVLAAAHAGRADVGLVYSSDAARSTRCRMLFRVPRTPVPIRYRGSVLDRGSNPVQARRLLDFLASPRAARRFRRCGFLPTWRES